MTLFGPNSYRSWRYEHSYFNMELYSLIVILYFNTIRKCL